MITTIYTQLEDPDLYKSLERIHIDPNSSDDEMRYKSWFVSRDYLSIYGARQELSKLERKLAEHNNRLEFLKTDAQEFPSQQKVYEDALSKAKRYMSRKRTLTKKARLGL